MKRFQLLNLFCVFSVFSFATPIDSIDLDTYLHQNNIKVQSTENGLYYHLDGAGFGDQPKAGDYVVINYVGRLVDGTIFDESGEEPFVFQLGRRQVIRGWESGIPLFKVGDKGTLYVPPHLGYGSVGAGKVIPPNAALIYEIELTKIMDYTAYDQYMAALDEREEMAFKKMQKEQFITDKRLINDYASEHKLRTKRLDSGVSYTLKKKGKGALPVEGNTVTIHYEGYLRDGSKFDSSYDRKQPFKFPIGKGKAIKGLDEAIRNFKKGSEGWILIPSKYAYGPMEIEEEGLLIPANSVLIFKVKVLKIEK